MAGPRDSEAGNRGDLPEVGPHCQSRRVPGRDGDTWPVGRDWYIRVSRETGGLGVRAWDSLRWAEGRARVLLGVLLRMHREDFGTLDPSAESVRECPRGGGEGGDENTW